MDKKAKEIKKRGSNPRRIVSVGLGNLDLILLVWGTSKVLEQKKFRDILFLFERNL